MYCVPCTILQDKRQNLFPQPKTPSINSPDQPIWFNLVDCKESQPPTIALFFSLSVDCKVFDYFKNELMVKLSSSAKDCPPPFSSWDNKAVSLFLFFQAFHTQICFLSYFNLV
ncbi:hypothetical protein L2E82_20690 [Cichorium intybus]|uniref:Uncharacterized protein n=1 Tax=Cichorium intybus TaxID=13427 RepID=A0ACB9DUD0_CICIN|nr:hypothetical protein L2E82_20690 [Cichorium intybus]